MVRNNTLILDPCSMTVNLMNQRSDHATLSHQQNKIRIQKLFFFFLKRKTRISKLYENHFAVGRIAKLIDMFAKTTDKPCLLIDYDRG